MNTVEPILLSWSGGKDSALALHALRQDPSLRVIGLLTSVTAGYDRISMHGVRGTLLREQADAVGLRLYEALIPRSCSNEQYEEVMGTTLAAIRAEHPGLERVAFGDLFLEDIRRYREERLAAAGLQAIFPVWGIDTGRLARDFIAAGFRARLVCVDTQQLDGAFVGRAFDEALLRDLPGGVDPCGERGEFHTFVSAGPEFRRTIEYQLGEVVLRDGRFAYCDLVEPAVAA